MRARLTLRPLFLRPPSKGRPIAALRTFTQNSASLSNRPHLPFLSIPSYSRQQFRYLTTERKQWIKYEAFLVVKYTIYFWAIVACGIGISFALSQEKFERLHPTPPEWTFRSRMGLRSAMAEKEKTDGQPVDYNMVLETLMDVLNRLEDEAKDGAEVRDVREELVLQGGNDFKMAEGPSSYPELPSRENLVLKLWAESGPKDISHKSEPWRRGYFETLLAIAQAMEHRDGCVIDKTRNIVFPTEVVIGPSNPKPQPIPPGSQSAPREEDCEPYMGPPEYFYLKLAETEGLNARQRTEALLSLAHWLEYKQDFYSAGVRYEQAVQHLVPMPEASTRLLSYEEHQKWMKKLVPALDWIANWTRRADSEALSENLLNSITAYATFKARRGDLSTALPIFIALLKARRTFSVSPLKPGPAGSTPQDEGGIPFLSYVYRIFIPRPYPPPRPNAEGDLPSIIDAKTLCEEAALQLHIGEIMYATKPSAREEGMAWTREAVDIAEAQLRNLKQSSGGDAAAKKTCRECLGTGLGNWSTMVAALAREEEAKQTVGEAPKGGWLSLWGDNDKVQEHGRWIAEEKVIKERVRRDKDLLEDLEPPGKGLASILYV